MKEPQQDAQHKTPASAKTVWVKLKAWNKDRGNHEKWQALVHEIIAAPVLGSSQEIEEMPAVTTQEKVNVMTLARICYSEARKNAIRYNGSQSQTITNGQVKKQDCEAFERARAALFSFTNGDVQSFFFVHTLVVRVTGGLMSPLTRRQSKTAEYFRRKHKTFCEAMPVNCYVDFMTGFTMPDLNGLTRLFNRTESAELRKCREYLDNALKLPTHAPRPVAAQAPASSRL